ncbi:MAG: 50S ribosomal protein L25/general stress protein Ctc [Chromatiales bacterium]|nr:50S ribosomal protein L25/general stress protein Ctc [Chromatiales bacterium]
MTASYEMTAEARTDMGKGASRRLRRQRKIPAILYGGGEAPMNVCLAENVLMRNLEDEAFYTSVINLKLDGGGTQSVVLKDIQHHPARPFILHVDLLRVSASDRIRMHVPLHFINEETAPGVKRGGIVVHSLIEVEVSCLVKDLPEYIEVDLSGLDMNESIHLSQLTLPADVELVELTHDNDLSVAAIQGKKGGSDEDAEGESGTEA